MSWPEDLPHWRYMNERSRKALRDQAWENERAYVRADRIEAFGGLGFVWPMRRPTKSTGSIEPIDCTKSTNLL